MTKPQGGTEGFDHRHELKKMKVSQIISVELKITGIHEEHLIC